MTITVIISIICLLLLVAYVFDISSIKTKFPSVVLLLILGWGIRQATNAVGINMPDLTGLLSILGTIGLIMIVLDGSLELEISKKKYKLIKKTSIAAVISLLVFSTAFSLVLINVFNSNVRGSILSAIALSVISSTVAISAAKNSPKDIREFVTYESCISDIAGIIIFNFILITETFTFLSTITFLFQLILIFIISIVTTFILALLISKNNHRVKFIPILIMVVLIYSLSKILNLPSLAFVMLFGLIIANITKIENQRIKRFFVPEKFNGEVKKMRDILSETTFMVRSSFFILFGFLVNNNELFRLETLTMSVAIVAGIFLIRLIIMKTINLPLLPSFFIAPRGMINVLMILSVSPTVIPSVINNSLLIQVILISSLVMAMGLMFSHKSNNIN